MKSFVLGKYHSLSLPDYTKWTGSPQIKSLRNKLSSKTKLGNCCTFRVHYAPVNIGWVFLVQHTCLKHHDSSVFRAAVTSSSCREGLWPTRRSERHGCTQICFVHNASLISPLAIQIKTIFITIQFDITSNKYNIY